MSSYPGTTSNVVARRFSISGATEGFGIHQTNDAQSYAFLTAYKSLLSKLILRQGRHTVILRIQKFDIRRLVWKLGGWSRWVPHLSFALSLVDWCHLKQSLTSPVARMRLALILNSIISIWLWLLVTLRCLPVSLHRASLVRISPLACYITVSYSSVRLHSNV